MEFEVKVFLLKLLLELTTNEDSREYLEGRVAYESNEKKVKINSSKLSTADLESLVQLAEDHYNKNVPDKNDKSVHNKYYPFLWLSRKVRTAIDVEQNADGTEKVKSLELIPLAMKAFFKEDPYKVIFKKNSDGLMLPYVITGVKFYPRDNRMGREAYADIDASGFFRGSKTTVSGKWKVAKRSCIQLLKEIEFVLPTLELIKGYESRIARYRELSDLGIGTQVNIVNVAKGEHKWIPMTVDGKPTKAVLDDTSDAREADEVESTTVPYAHLTFWRDQDIVPLDIFADLVQKSILTEDDEEEDTRQYTVYPIHPYLKCFDLNKHRFVTAHVANIEDYPWDHHLSDKLVLDTETKDLIEILVDSTKSRTEDIIAGKMSGTIVLATGVPGVGKTLTAEVFSEKIEKSLYVVQCSQLGIDINSIEKNLQHVLDRASRWGSILLIDEADVYIRDRGTDIVHNAIVGVFLRLIEYYNGVLFMTSNRGDIIDDAIISRATAWIQYNIPAPDLLNKIWKVLSTQFEVDLSDRIIQELVKEIPNISGRTVRNLLKLVKALDYEPKPDKAKQQQANFGYILKASKFQKLEG